MRVFIQTEPLTSELMEIGHTFTAELTVDASAWERAQLRAADVQLCVMLPNDRMHRPPPGMKAIWGHTAMVLLPVTSAPAEAAPASVVLRASMPRFCRAGFYDWQFVSASTAGEWRALALAPDALVKRGRVIVHPPVRHEVRPLPVLVPAAPC
jgi:hypothetical protein